MSTDNREQFNVLTGKILRMLVNACPAQVELNAEAFDLETGSYDIPSGVIGGFYEATPQEQFLADTLRWLIAEGLIRDGEHTDHYVATFRSLELYGSIPNALKS
ncbi:hypothetical protein [Pseudomonas sp.]|uniref:hypothetical protein n=1 Tax=Pseudomonas sp. TaxID=306 RepID=UPI002E338775|nr:hypothetical protein [Pseudomonas sp.]HEX4549809.1 hypothetical protein [Pseudomonas sp.]